MFWTEEHDIMMCREILAVDPFSGTKKGTVQRGAKWNEIVNNLLRIENPKFKVDQRAVRDRYTLLSQKLRRKLRDEEQASGIDTDMTEVEDALEDIIDIEDNSIKQVEYEAGVKMKEMDKEKQSAEDVRRRAMEKLGETQKRNGDKASVDNERQLKKKRSNGNDTLIFLREKNAMETEMRKEEMELKRRTIELQEKKHDDLMSLVIQQQQQQSKQMQDFQTMMLTMMAKFGTN